MAASVDGRRVLVIDLLGYQQQSFVAEHLARGGASVVVATPFPQVGQNIGFTHIRGHLERLYGLGADLRTSTVLAGIENGAATLRHVYARTMEPVPVDLVVAGTMASANTELYEAASAVASEVLLAGDAVAPRTALRAFREGDDAGRAV